MPQRVKTFANTGPGAKVYPDDLNGLQDNYVPRDDPRLTDSRTPKLHRGSHEPGGSDSLFNTLEVVQDNLTIVYDAAQQPPGTVREYVVRISRELDGTRQRLYRLVIVHTVPSSASGAFLTGLTDLGGTDGAKASNFQVQALDNTNAQLLFTGETPGSGFPFRAQIRSRRIF